MSSAYTGSNQLPDPQALGFGREALSRTSKSGFVTSDLLPMSVGSVTGKASIISKLWRARRMARMDMIRQLEDWVLQHVPKSEKAHFHLEDAVLQQLRFQSTDEQIKIGAPGVPYAAYVDAMNPPVNWTKATPKSGQYHWFENMIKKSNQILVPSLAKAIQALGLANARTAAATARVMANG